MDFGKLESIDHIDFTLPKDPDFNLETFARLNPISAEDQTLYIGTTAWAEKSWVGSYFPPKTKSTEFLHYYSQQFNTIELNTTFYRIPELSTIIKWYNQSTSDFRFCPKVYQFISRSNNLGVTGNDLDSFISSAELLGDKLGPSFLQLPSHSDTSNFKALMALLEKVNSRIPLSIEFRHPSWFQDFSETSFTSLRENNIATVITDVAGRRDVCHMYVTNASVLVRFVGNNLVPSDYVRINDWIERMQQWFKMGVESIYFFVHEPDTAIAPVLATYLGEEWKIKSTVKTRYPKIEFDDKKQLSLF